MSFTPAARKDDLVKHTYSNESMVVFAVVGGGIGAFLGSFVPVAGTAVGGSIGIGIGQELGRWLGENTWVADNLGAWKEGIPAIKDGSYDVWTNRKNAARSQDIVSCHDKKIIQGSLEVSINMRPATRIDDLTECGAIGSGSADVWIGGPPATEGEYSGATSALLSFGISVAGGMVKNMAKMTIGAALKAAFIDEVKELARDQVTEALRANGMGSMADAYDGFRNLQKWDGRFQDVGGLMKPR